MNKLIYLCVYLPINSLFAIFYIMVLIIILRKRKDSILGSTFFKLTFLLGTMELATFTWGHLFYQFPSYGILIDEFFLRVQGILPYLCSYVTITIVTIQYMLISMCSFNRFVVIVGPHQRKRFYNRLTMIITVALMLVSMIVYSPVFYASTFTFVDYRQISPNTTIVCQCIGSNKLINDLNELFITLARVSNVVFSLFLYAVIFACYCTKRHNGKSIINHDSSKSTKLEIRIAIAVFIHALIAAIVSFLYVAAFYIWPERILDLLGFIYITEDVHRILSPILLLIFSRPLRTVFMKMYLGRTVASSTVTYSKVIPLQKAHA